MDASSPSHRPFDTAGTLWPAGSVVARPPVPIPDALPAAPPDAVPPRVLHARPAGHGSGAGADPLPWVLFAPGYGTSVGLGFWGLLARRLVGEGFAVFGCQFSGSGFGDDLRTCDELDRFARNHYGHELADLEAARSWIRSADGIDPDRGVLVGHSRGGGMGIVHAAEAGSWRGVAVWNAIDTILRFSPERLAAWRAEGSIEVVHWGARARVRLPRSVLEAAGSGPPRYDPTAAAARLACPLLVVQGEADRAVETASGARLAQAAADGRLHVVAGGDHTFGVSTRRGEPEPTDEVGEAVGVTVEFVRRVTGGDR